MKKTKKFGLVNSGSIPKIGLGPVLNFIREGLSPVAIAKHYLKSEGKWLHATEEEKKKLVKKKLKQIEYYTTKLKDLGCVQKDGYGAWSFLKEVQNRPKATIKGQNLDLSKKSVRGHAFIWKIEFYDPIDWHRVIPQYKKSTLTFQHIGKGKGYFRTILNDRKIWLTNDGLVIYDALDFFGPSSFSVKGDAVFQMDLLVKDLLRKVGLRFREYRFTTSREHYALIKNALAKQYNDRKEKLYIKNDEGTVWQWIDHSKGEHERETTDPVINRQIQNYENTHKKFGYKHDANFINNLDENLTIAAELTQKNASNLDYHAENMRSHVGATKDLSLAATKINENLELQNQLFKKILEKLG